MGDWIIVHSPQDYHNLAVKVLITDLEPDVVFCLVSDLSVVVHGVTSAKQTVHRSEEQVR